MGHWDGLQGNVTVEQRQVPEMTRKLGRSQEELKYRMVVLSIVTVMMEVKKGCLYFIVIIAIIVLEFVCLFVSLFETGSSSTELAQNSPGTGLKLKATLLPQHLKC